MSGLFQYHQHMLTGTIEILHASDFGRLQGRATKCRNRCCKEVIMCGSKVVPEVRFAKKLVEKRLPDGDRCRRAGREQKHREKTIPVFCRDITHIVAVRTCFAFKFATSFRPWRVTTCLEAVFWRPFFFEKKAMRNQSSQITQ